MKKVYINQRSAEPQVDFTPRDLPSEQSLSDGVTEAEMRDATQDMIV
ncbi:hypothetical protein P775_01550 [Puniceibacterium antarcticum]|uniref:Uncharacterized protein n=1 Tax=Puniceibacterium antarcticum TaxID=1206336 RepID=A0A2G8RKC6_9RHOB|nr:hypothetical protein [Puniceibacterium antarcticum]PIL22010.1 hypothetical protein P775_01550 [Puniceibacterium antarcticum]